MISLFLKGVIMSIKIEVVDCPKCKIGKMVPLSRVIHAEVFNPPRDEVIHFAEWRCVNCGYSVKSS